MMNFTFYDKNGRCIESVRIKPHFFKQLIDFGICRFMLEDKIAVRDEDCVAIEKVCKLTDDIREGILGVLRLFLTALVATAIGELKAASISRKTTHRLDAPIFQDGIDRRPMYLSIEQMYDFFVWQVESCLKIAKYISDDQTTHFNMD